LLDPTEPTDLAGELARCAFLGTDAAVEAAVTAAAAAEEGGEEEEGGAAEAVLASLPPLSRPGQTARDTAWDWDRPRQGAAAAAVCLRFDLSGPAEELRAQVPAARRTGRAAWAATVPVRLLANRKGPGGTVFLALLGLAAQEDEEEDDDAIAAAMAAGCVRSVALPVPTTCAAADACIARLDRAARPGPVLSVLAPTLSGADLVARLAAGGQAPEGEEIRVEETVVVP